MNVVAIAFIPCNLQDKVSKYLESSLEFLIILVEQRVRQSVFLVTIQQILLIL